MKRLLHNLSRLLVLLIVFNFAARPAAAENTSDEIKVSTATHEYWYTIRFCRNNIYGIHPDGDMLKLGACDDTEEYQWKFVAAPSVGYYYLVNRNGRYMDYSDSRFRLTDSAPENCEIHLITEANNSSAPDEWQIQRNGSSNSMNAVGNVGEGKELGEWGKTDPNNPVIFTLVDENLVDVYLQFSSYGPLALYDGGVGTAPVARNSAGTPQPADAGFRWSKLPVEGGYNLRSGNGNYLALAADGASLEMTSDVAAALTFTTPLNDYVKNVNGVAGQPVERFKYLTAGKALSVDAGSGTVTLTDRTDSRAALLRETQTIDGAEPPAVVGSGDEPVWYWINFSTAGRNLAIGTGNNHPALVGEPNPSLYMSSMLWCLERSDENDDDFFLRNAEGMYLYWNMTVESDAGNDFFAATADRTAASLFRLSEYTDYGDARGKWLLHYIGAKRSFPDFQYLRPRDNNAKVKLTPVGDLQDAALTFEQAAYSPDLFSLPQIYVSTPEHEYWYNIRFANNQNLALHPEDGMLKSGNFADEDQYVWKLVAAPTDGYCYLVSKTGQYVSFSDSRFRMTDNPAEACEVRLVNNLSNRYPYDWQIQRQGTANTLNPSGGLSAGKEMSEYGSGDPNNPLIFTLVEDPSVDVYLQFSSYGRLALFDNGAGNAPSAREPGNNVTRPADKGYLWTKIKTADGYILRSDLGNYVALDAGGNALVTVPEAERALHFTLGENDYAKDVNRTGGYPLRRYCYMAGGRALGVDPVSGAVGLTDATGLRATILRETQEIDGAEPPVMTEAGDCPVWYYINSSANGLMMSLPAANGSELTFAEKSSSLFNHLQIWSFEMAGQPDEFYLRATDNRYFGWSASTATADGEGCFTLVADRAAAAPFRLSEFAEQGADRDKWMLHYVGPKPVQPACQYLRPATDNLHALLAPATALSKSGFSFVLCNSSPDGLTAGDHLWRRIYFQGQNQEFADLLVAAGGSPVAGDAIDEAAVLWKNIGTADDFILLNMCGSYIALNDTRDGYRFTTDISAAAHFSARQACGVQPAVGWQLTDLATGNVLAKGDEGRLVLLSPGEVDETNGGNTILVFDEIRVEGDYYVKIGSGDKWLCDGLGDVYDAVSSPLGRIRNGTVMTDDFLWRFVEAGDYAFLKNRNGNYLVWNTQGDATFAISKDEARAAHFRWTPGADAGTRSIILVGGEGVGEGDTDKYLTFDTAGNAVLSETGTALTAESFVINPAEDYTAYSILPKRSWFVRLTDDQEETSNSFIHSTSDGSYGRKPFTLSDGTTILRQNTNDYRIVRYVKRNTMRELRLPTSMYAGDGTATRVKAYTRFYDYNTDGRIPDNLVLLNQQSRRDYRNGTVMGSLLPLNGATSGDFVQFGFNFKMPDDAPDDYEFTVGLDASLYTDFVDYYGDNPGTTAHPLSQIINSTQVPVDADLIEPTLTGRCIYVVRNAHIMARQLTALPESQDKWLEEYNVNFPARKVNLTDCALMLENEFANYWIYRGGEPAEENLVSLTRYANLEFRVVNNTAGISLIECPVSGGGNANSDLSTLRFFRFKYPSANGEERVPNNSSADIEVYAKDGTNRYRLATYHLTFVDGTEARPYTEIIGLKPDGTPKSRRSPRQLRRDLGEPKAHINFDFKNYEPFLLPPVGRNTAAKQDNGAPGGELPNTYRYPLRYENSAYQFQPTRIRKDGVVEENTFGSYTIAKTVRFGWNNQARFYPVTKYYADEYPDEGYDWDNAGFLYIDASECPGRILSLDFDGNICKGSRITISAWISSPNSPNRIAAEAYANVFFNILGYYKDAQGVEHEEKIYTYCPGPIGGDAKCADGSIIESTEDGIGVWQQIYFSFIPRSEHIISRFVLNVNNGCTNSAGGDILLDDIEVYAATPTVRVANSLPVCHSELTLTQIEADYEVLLDALGLEEDKLSELRPSINYCVVDYDLYNSEKKRLEEAGAPTPANTAMELAAVGNIRRANIDQAFDQLPAFTHAGALGVKEPTVWARTDDGGIRQIVISDKIVHEKLRPGKRYYLAAYITYSNEQVDFSNFQVGTDCSVSTQFVTHKSFTFIIDGATELPDGEEASVCAGSNVTLSARFRGIGDESGLETSRVLPCDWWLNFYGGDFDSAYIDDQGNFLRDYAPQPGSSSSVTSVSQALSAFRFFYPEALAVDSTCKAAYEPTTNHRLTKAMLDGLRALSEPVRGAGGRPALLQLFRRTINLQIPASMQADEEYIVSLQPINGLIEADEDLKDCIICFDANSVAMRVNGQAPGLLAGFGDVVYPSYITNVPLRLTLEQVGGMRTQPLRLPLRAIRPVTEGALGLTNIPLADTDGTFYTPVYLAGTSDPSLASIASEAGLPEVGRLTAMEAKAGQQEGYADIKFLNGFTPREGYTYTLRVDYQEDLPEGVLANTCNGSFVTDVKIVPRYVVWTAAAGNTDWTNDLNWRRADRSDLHFDTASDISYVSNAFNGTAAAFVPAAGTSVIVAPHDKYQPTLYAAEAEGDHTLLDFTGHEDAVTADIAYDLLARTADASGSSYVCQAFRTNRCDGIVLQAGAELPQAQHLHYQRAWTEHEVDAGRWYTLATPLQEIYAGDWYAPTATGREDAPYFRDLTFSAGRNDRFAPAVYQRGWDKAEAKLHYLSNPADPGSGVQELDVAVRAEWSSVYNEVSVPYSQGGFSLKAEKPGDGKLLFRLPKEDVAYDYFVKDNPNGSNRTEIARTAAHHRLWTDSLVTAAAFTVKAPNNVQANNYHLIGNPFPCGLDMGRFFEVNASKFEAPKYWMLTAGGQTAVLKDTGSGQWISVNQSADATTPQVVAAGQGFFVKLRDGQEPEFSFSADMMVSATPQRVGLKAPQRRAAAVPDNRVLRIRAGRDGLASEALLMQDAAATDTYDAAEDIETLLDGNLDAAPTVYTLAGNRAATFNRRRTLGRVPLGVTGRSDGEVTLTFTGMDNFMEELSLLDTATGQTTLLSTGEDSVSVRVPGRTSRRFFIVSSAFGGDLDDAVGEAIRLEASHGEVTVTAPGGQLLEQVSAVASDGRTYHASRPAKAVHSFRLEPGIYVITARTAEAATTRKLVVTP